MPGQIMNSRVLHFEAAEDIVPDLLEKIGDTIHFNSDTAVGLFNCAQYCPICCGGKVHR